MNDHKFMMFWCMACAFITVFVFLDRYLMIDFITFIIIALAMLLKHFLWAFLFCWATYKITDAIKQIGKDK